MKPELTVVVPARNASATIGDQLDALLGQQCERPWELIVVDNGSADDTPSIVAQYAERDGRVRLLTANGVRSAAFSRNAGISAARSEAIACCDADDIVAPGWLRAMSEALERAELVAGRIDVHRLNPEWLAATRGTAIERGPGDFMGLCQFAHGANMGVRKSVIERFGGFDEQLPIGEDIELSHRLERGGVRLFYADNAVVFFRYRATFRDLWQQSRSFGRAQPTLARVVGAADSSTDGQELRRWAWLARSVPLLRTREGRARWVWTAGGRVGRIEARLRPQREYFATVRSAPKAHP